MYIKSTSDFDATIPRPTGHWPRHHVHALDMVAFIAPRRNPSRPRRPQPRARRARPVPNRASRSRSPRPVRVHHPTAHLTPSLHFASSLFICPPGTRWSLPTFRGTARAPVFAASSTAPRRSAMTRSPSFVQHEPVILGCRSSSWAAPWVARSAYRHRWMRT